MPLTVGFWPLNRFPPRRSSGFVEAKKRFVLISADSWTQKISVQILGIRGEQKKISADPCLSVGLKASVPIRAFRGEEVVRARGYPWTLDDVLVVFPSHSGDSPRWNTHLFLIGFFVISGIL